MLQEKNYLDAFRGIYSNQPQMMDGIYLPFQRKTKLTRPTFELGEMIHLSC